MMRISLIISFLLYLSNLLTVDSFSMAKLVKIKSTHTTKLNIEMKGRKLPIDQRGQYVKNQKMMEQQAEMMKNKPKDVPIFKIFVRPVAGGIWIPCGDLAGDQRATALVNAWTSGFMTDMYKNQLEQGIARSVFNQEDSFVKGIVENFKPFKKFTKEQLQFGFKVEFPGVQEKFGDVPITPLVKGMEKGWFDNVKDGLGGLFSQK